MLKVPSIQYKDVFVAVLVDSGASFNFASSQLIKWLGWKPYLADSILISVANGATVESILRYTEYVLIGKWLGSISFCILDLLFDMVIKMPWLGYFNPCISWTEGNIDIKHGNRWIQLSSVFLFCYLLNNAAISTTETCRPIEVVSVALFRRGLASDTIVCLGFIELISDKSYYHYTHRAVHRSIAKGETTAKSDRLLYDLERDYPTVFYKPIYPILLHHTPFSISLIDKSV